MYMPGKYPIADFYQHWLMWTMPKCKCKCNYLLTCQCHKMNLRHRKHTQLSRRMTEEMSFKTAFKGIYGRTRSNGHVQM